MGWIYAGPGSVVDLRLVLQQQIYRRVTVAGGNRQGNTPDVGLLIDESPSAQQLLDDNLVAVGGCSFR